MPILVFMPTTMIARTTLILVLAVSMLSVTRETAAQGSRVGVEPKRAVAELKRAVAEPKRADRVDCRSLDGKVMVGYQGWFNAPGDGMGLGWKHWAAKPHQPFSPQNVTVDLWPDVSELDEDEKYQTEFHHADGTPAFVFSSANRKTVSRHFQWMREYGIDGAFLQRFGNGLAFPKLRQNKDHVLQHVKSAAETNGRAFAIMYDLSGMKPESLKQVVEDWRRIQSEYNLSRSQSYLHHQGKPLVAIWGIGFKSRHADGGYSLQECQTLVKNLKQAGCSIMLGIPTGWREQNRDSVNDPLFHEIIRQADILSPWTVGRYTNQDEVKRHRVNDWEPDQKWCDQNQLQYMPVLFPGFSWHHLKNGDSPLGQIPRQKGAFFRAQIDEAIQANAKMVYIAMFDEVDEGTAIFKCTNDPPVGDHGKFLTLEGLPSDHYLKLTGNAGQRLRRSLKSGEPEEGRDKLPMK